MKRHCTLGVFAVYFLSLCIVVQSIGSSSLSGFGVPNGNPSFNFSVAANSFSPNSICASSITTEITNLLSGPKYKRSYWGVSAKVEGATSSFSPVVSFNSNKAFSIPSARLFSLGAAYKSLPLTQTYNTEFHGGSDTLCVIGSGDPSMTSQKLISAIQVLKDSGITSVQNLILDPSIYQGMEFSDASDMKTITSSNYPPASAFVLDRNRVELAISPGAQIGDLAKASFTDSTQSIFLPIRNNVKTVANDQPQWIKLKYDLGIALLSMSGQIRVGSAPIIKRSAVHPANVNFQITLVKLMNLNGITVNNSTVGSCGSAASLAQVANIMSDPLQDMIAAGFLNSDNLYAESFLKKMGLTVTTKSGSTLQDGLNKVTQVLGGLGLSGYSLVDGSGASLSNLMTPDSVTSLLVKMISDQFISMLPLAGRTGNLADRFSGTPADNIVRADASIHQGRATLSGYILNPSYKRVVFSITATNSNLKEAELQRAVDDVLYLLLRLSDCL